MSVACFTALTNRLTYVFLRACHRLRVYPRFTKFSRAYRRLRVFPRLPTGYRTCFPARAIDYLFSRAYTNRLKDFALSSDWFVTIMFQINTCKHSKAFREFLLSLGWPVDVASHPGWAGNIQEAWNRGKNDDDTVTLRQRLSPFQSSHSVSTLTGIEERDVSGNDNDGFTSCRESPDSETSRNGKDSPAVDSSVTQPPVEKIVDEILYYADVSCEVAFIMPSLLPRYQRFRHMVSRPESCEEDLGYVQRRRTRSGSTGSMETTGNGSGSQLDVRSKLSRQASEGTTAFEVNCHCIHACKVNTSCDKYLK